jgi:SurA N-terminal domain
MRKIVLIAAMAWALPVVAQQPQPKPEPPAQAPPVLENPGATPDAPKPAAAPTPMPKAMVKPSSVTSGSRVIEEIIARVNNDIITQTDYQKELASAEDDAKQECEGRCTPEQLQADIQDRKKNALRDLIDQSLLVQRGKDMGSNWTKFAFRTI